MPVDGGSADAESVGDLSDGGAGGLGGVQNRSLLDTMVTSVALDVTLNLALGLP